MYSEGTEGFSGLSESVTNMSVLRSSCRADKEFFCCGLFISNYSEQEVKGSVIHPSVNTVGRQTFAGRAGPHLFDKQQNSPGLRRFGF